MALVSYLMGGKIGTGFYVCLLLFIDLYVFHSDKLFFFLSFHPFSTHFFSLEDRQICLNAIVLCKTFCHKKHFQTKENENFIFCELQFYFQRSFGHSFSHKSILTTQLIVLSHSYQIKTLPRVK